MDLATVDDLVTAWRPLTDTESSAAANLLAVASAVIRRRFPTIDTRIATGDIEQVIVTHVAAELVRRFLSTRNPDEPVQQGAGPFTAGWPQAVTARAMVLNGDDLGMLAPVTTSTRARTIRLGLGITPP